MSKLTDQFKQTKYIVEGYVDAERLLKALFALGFKWYGTEDRTIRLSVFSNGGVIFVNEDCRLTWGWKRDITSHPDYPVLTVDDVERVVPKHKAEKKALKKASKKRKQIRKQGWTLHVGNDQPVADDVNIAVMFDDYSFSRKYDRKARRAQWTQGNWDTTLAYKVEPANVVSQQEMVDDIVSSAGGVEVDPSTVTFEEFVIEMQQPFTGYKHGEAGSVVAAPDTNPKKQFGDKSIPMYLWSPLATAYGAVSLYNGSLKYGRGNYRASPVEASIYISAAMRHLLAWAEGEEFDPADGCPNLGGVLANIAILIDSRAAGSMIDDRQIASGYLKEREALKEIIAKLQVLHEGKNPRHYTLADGK